MNIRKGGTLLGSIVDDFSHGGARKSWEFSISFREARRVEFIDEINWAHLAIQRGVRSVVEASLDALPVKFSCKLYALDDPHPDTCVWEIMDSLQFAVRRAWEIVRQETRHRG
jgi:hypothetical protein